MKSNQPDSSSYWDDNLDAANLGGEVSDSAASLDEELKFAQAPDIQAMLSWVGAGDNAKAVQTGPPRRMVLELGTGLGANAVLLQRSGINVVALDISHERLKTLRARTGHLTSNNLNGARIFPVRARAEALPFRPHSLDGAFSRAVLIHTDMGTVCEELQEVLAPAAPVAFSEPMADNPLVNLYRRTLAPREWKTITRYFRKQEIDAVASHFSHTETRYYYLSAFAAFVFQYALPAPRLFYPTLKILGWADRKLIRTVPGSCKKAWFVLITGRTPQ